MRAASALPEHSWQPAKCREKGTRHRPKTGRLSRGAGGLTCSTAAAAAASAPRRTVVPTAAPGPTVLSMGATGDAFGRAPT